MADDAQGASGVERGDVLLAIDGRALHSVFDYGAALAGAGNRIAVTFRDIRTGQVKNVPALRAHVYDLSIVEGRIMVSTTPAAWRPL